MLDSLGIGEAPDAASFGDCGANTLRRISASDAFHIPNLTRLGLGCIDGVDYIEKCDTPPTVIARLEEVSQGKDTTIGHLEIAGVRSERPLPTYPDGFPKEVIEAFKSATGFGVLCNRPYSGTEVIKDFGLSHELTGHLIVYTSADSVFQIAANEDVVPLPQLYRVCEKARELLTGEHGVGRVIARPFRTDENGNYVRTANRRDFSLKPPAYTLLDRIKDAGKEVISVGKISDIFAGVGITEANPTHSNAEGMRITEEILDWQFEGLCFTNLVDFDMVYGHRQNVDGYAKALTEFDEWLGGFIEKMGEDDALIITADHGCDPGDSSTDHTREYVPFIMYGKRVTPEQLGTVRGFDFVARNVCSLLEIDYGKIGKKK